MPSGTVPASGSERLDVVFVQAPAISESSLDDRFPRGSRLVLLTVGKQSHSVVNLTREFFAAADPQVSYDGRRVIFAGRSAREAYWQIWEMNLDGSEKHQLTNCPGDCLRPAYLPHDEIVFTAVHGRGSSASTVLVVSKRDGTNPHPITFGPGNFVVETVLRDGRILASALSPLLPDHAAPASRDLYTLRLDGTGLASFRCDHQHLVTRTEAEELDDGSVVYVKKLPGAQEGDGVLALIRRGDLHNSALSPLRAIAWPSPPFAAGLLIVSRKVTPRQGGPGKFDLYTLDPASGKVGGLVFDDPHLSSIQAAPVAAHPQPRWFWSTVKPNAPVGYFICLDSSLTRDVPKGRFSTSVAQVRVLTLDAATGGESAMGVAPVEKDGSFYIAVPPDRPVRFELLDANGKPIHAQRSWIWVRPGEEHGCVGCHEDKAIAPPNRWPLALQRFDTPTRLGAEPSLSIFH